MNDYMMQNAHTLFSYYSASTSDKPSIHSFFNIPDPKEQEETTKSKFRHAQEYMSNINPDYILHEKEDFQITCEDCGVRMKLMVDDGQYICPNCGLTMEQIVDSERVSFKEPPKEVAYFCYKRMNHFNEWLAQFQAKESTDIPGEVYRKVLVELDKDKYSNAKQITAERVKGILRRLGYNSRYYEHVHHIMNRIAGIRPPNIDRKTEEILRMMFR